MRKKNNGDGAKVSKPALNTISATNWFMWLCTSL